MNNAELGIVLFNLSGAYLAGRIALSYGWSILRDHRELIQLGAGVVVFFVFYELLRVVFDGIYYGSARVAQAAGHANMWSDPFWSKFLLATKVLFMLALLCAPMAKYRADGLDWGSSFRKTRLLMLEAVLVTTIGAGAVLTYLSNNLGIT